MLPKLLRKTCHSLFPALLVILVAATSLWADDEATVSEARTDGNGFLVHEVRSPYQAATTLIRVLRPDNELPGKVYPVVYVLPVEAGTENRYGDGLIEIKRLNLHHTCEALFVAPTFSQLPWYADHPTKLEIRQESHFLKVVVPLIDRNYPVQAAAEGRLLLGFSKSGWGAWSLLLRHPDLFQRACAWDAPMMMDQPGSYGSGEIFDTSENFDRYRVSRLLENTASEFQRETRLILLGYGNFRAEHLQAHALMEQRKILHEYRDGPARKHDWHSGWVEDAVKLLLANRTNSTDNENAHDSQIQS